MVVELARTAAEHYAETKRGELLATREMFLKKYEELERVERKTKRREKKQRGEGVRKSARRVLRRNIIC